MLWRSYNSGKARGGRPKSTRTENGSHPWREHRACTTVVAKLPCEVEDSQVQAPPSSKHPSQRWQMRRTIQEHYHHPGLLLTLETEAKMAPSKLNDHNSPRCHWLLHTTWIWTKYRLAIRRKRALMKRSTPPSLWTWIPLRLKTFKTTTTAKKIVGKTRYSLMASVATRINEHPSWGALWIVDLKAKVCTSFELSLRLLGQCTTRSHFMIIIH